MAAGRLPAVPRGRKSCPRICMPSAAGENDRLRRDELVRWIRRRNRARRQLPDLAVRGADAGMRRPHGGRREERDRLAVAERLAGSIRCWRRFVRAAGVPPLAATLQRCRRSRSAASARCLVRAVDDRRPIRGERDVLDLERARRQQRWSAARGGNRIEMKPAVAFPWKNETVSGRPQDLAAGIDSLEDAAAARLGAEDFSRRHSGRAGLPRLQVGDADRPRLAGASRVEGELIPERRNTSERQASSIRRPRGVCVAIDARDRSR